MNEQARISKNQGELSTDLPDGDARGMGDRLCIDFVERWQRGERVPVEAYLQQHPDLESEETVFELVLTEVVLRQSLGEATALDEYLRRFPQFADRLERHFALQERIEASPSLLEGSTLLRSQSAFETDETPDLSGYEIVGELGRGGMGIIYQARDTRLDRPVALKFLPSEYTDDHSRLERFLREARTASALNHPHICTVHALGEHEGRPFIVMEFIEGFTLRALAKQEPRIEDAARLVAQVAQALAVAHAEGVVHRDVKPENIMIRGDGYVKVVDFGLARRLPNLAPPAPGFAGDTDPGTLLGTVAYMAPEQAKGQPAGNASDVFSLGVVLYEIMTGQHPFEADSTLGMLSLIANAEVISPNKLNPEIPPGLNGLIEAMLRKDAALRPSAAEVETALNRAIRDRAAQSVPVRTRQIVHRERELKALRSAWNQAKAGRGNMICVTGEPGIGKTTLVEDFLDELLLDDPECLIARGRCSERLAGTEAYLPVLDALSDLVRTQSTGTAARLLKVVAPSWSAQVTGLAHPTSRQSEEPGRASSQHAMLREFAGFLQEVSRLGPVVLFFDDIHWADVSTVDLLSHVGRLGQEMRVLTLVTHRPTELLLGPHPFYRVRQELQMQGHCTELSMSFLGPKEIDRYLALAFPDHAFPKDFTDLIHARTEGSPLFVADLLRDLRERGVIAESESRWTLIQDLPDLQHDLPESVRSMIGRKFERLEAEDRQLLSAASVQGHEFDSAVVADAIGLEPADVEERLQALDQIHGLVRRLRESEYPDRSLTVRYAFVHILYQQALYHDLQPSRRAALGAALARSLKNRQGEGNLAAAELACLYEVARDFSQAARQFHLAAQNAAHVFAHREAAELARRGLSLLKPLPESAERAALELPLQTILGMQLQVTEGFAASEAKRAYLRARDLCRQTPDSALLFPVLWGLWLYSKVRSELDRAREMANELQQLASRLRDPDLAIQAHQALGMTAFCRGRPVAAVEHVEQVSALYNPVRHRRHAFMFGQDPAVICKAYGAVALWLMGFADQAERQSQEAITMSRGLSPSSQAVALHFAAMLHQLRQEDSRVADCALKSRAIAAEHGFSFWLAGGQVLGGWALAAGGHHAEGIQLLREGLRDWMATDSVTYQTYYLGLLADVLERQGRHEEGWKAIEEALALVAQTHEKLYEPELRRLRGELLWKLGNPAGANQCFQRALSAARERQTLGLELRAAVSLARLARNQGQRAEARIALEPVYNKMTEGSGTRDCLEAAALLGELA